MGISTDRTEKKENWKPAEPIVIMAEDHADKLICLRCGRQYTSSGKHDPGYCRACLREMDEENAMLNGGPLDGHKAHEQDCKSGLLG